MEINAIKLYIYTLIIIMSHHFSYQLLWNYSSTNYYPVVLTIICSSAPSDILLFSKLTLFLTSSSSSVLSSSPPILLPLCIFMSSISRFCRSSAVIGRNSTRTMIWKEDTTSTMFGIISTQYMIASETGFEC